MNILPPCKGCEKREIGCHAICDKYKTWRALKDEEKARLTKIAIQEQIQNDIERDRKTKIATGKWRHR